MNEEKKKGLKNKSLKRGISSNVHNTYECGIVLK